MSPFQLNFRNAFIQEWSGNVQRQVGNTWLFDVGYVGTRGLHLVQETDPNQPLNMTDVANASPAVQASTLAACEAGSCPAPIPYLANFAYTQSAGSSIYHALQAKIERRFSKGLSILAAYTYSKSIDTTSGPFMDARNANFPQNSYDVAAEKSRVGFQLSAAVVPGLYLEHALRHEHGKAPQPEAELRGTRLGSGQRAHCRVRPPFTPVVSGNVSGADEINNPTVQVDTDRRT